jgi:hypothetical protein
MLDSINFTAGSDFPILGDGQSCRSGALDVMLPEENRNILPISRKSSGR